MAVLRRRVRALVAVAALTLSALLIGGPSAIAQPNGTQYFASTTSGGFSFIGTSGFLILSVSPSSPTRFKVVGGNELEQAGTSKCLTLDTFNEQWFMASPCNGRPTQQFDYHVFSTGAEQIISADNGLCTTDVGGMAPGNVVAETCSNSNVTQRWRWHS